MDVITTLLLIGGAFLLFLGAYSTGIRKERNHQPYPSLVLHNKKVLLVINTEFNTNVPLSFITALSRELPAKFILFLQRIERETRFQYEFIDTQSNRAYIFAGRKVWYGMRKCWHIVIFPNLDHATRSQCAENNKALLHSIIQNIPDAIGLTNEELVYQACNPAFVRALGIESPEHLLGKTLEEAAAKEVSDKFAYSDQNVLESGREFHIIDEVTDEDGNRKWMEARKLAYIDPTTNKKGLFILARDITERETVKEKLNQTKDKFKRLSLIDSLTGIGNRRYFDESLEMVWQEHVQHRRPLTIMLCDIDDFNLLNQAQGHQVGDRALCLVAKTLESSIQSSSDMVFRIGGEEFAFILSDTELEKACEVAKQVHKRVKALSIAHADSDNLSTLTLSIGMHCVTSFDNSSLDVILKEAGEALYKAKLNGKNQTVCAA